MAKRKPVNYGEGECGYRFCERGNASFHEALRKEKACREARYYEPWLDGGIIVQEP